MRVGVSADFSPAEVARRTGLSRSLIYREIERGHLRAYRVGGRLRIKPEAVAEWKRRGEVRAAYEPLLRQTRLDRRAESDGFAAELRAIPARSGRAA